MEKNKVYSGMDNPKWIEEDLFKLPCKELKKLARKSNVNPNFKKAELVKALLNSSVPVVLEQSEFKENEKSARRMTRSRVSIYQRPKEVEGLVVTELTTNTTRTHSIDNVVDINEIKKPRKGKEKRKSVVLESISDMFKIVSSIKIKSRALVEVTCNKTEANIGEAHPSDTSEKSLRTKSRRSDLKTKPSLRNSKVNVKRNSEKGEKIEKESMPQAFDKNHSNSGKNEKEESCSQDIDNILEVKCKRKGRKKELKEQSNLTIEGNTTSEAIIKIETSEVKLDQNQKPKAEKKRKLRKQKKEEEIEERKNNTEVEVKISDGNVSTELELENQRKTSAKISKSDSSDMSEEKDISGVLSMSATSLLNKQNDSSSLQLIDESVDNKRSSRSSEVSMGKNMIKTNHSAQDLFADDEVYAEKPSNISVKSSNNNTAMPVAVPLRSSTFILDSPDQERNGSGRKKSFDKPSRSNTFTIDENDDKSSKMPKRSSLRFIAAPALQQKPASSGKPKKIEASIGKRILSVFGNKKNTESAVKFEKPNLGSSLKKTITKSTTTPAYLNKFGVARKAPNFKNIHQKLFENMESLGENRQRKMDRALDLLQSPAPRCAVSRFSPRVSLEKTNKLSTPVQPSAPLATTKTPGTVTAGTQLNRFGFKTRTNKLEAKAIVAKKLPPVSMEKTKENDRKFLQGVRTNKRFMLQMQMRQNKQ